MATARMPPQAKRVLDWEHGLKSTAYEDTAERKNGGAELAEAAAEAERVFLLKPEPGRIRSVNLDKLNDRFGRSWPKINRKHVAFVKERGRNYERLLAKLWPEEDWATAAETDPWGAAVRRAFREELQAYRRGIWRLPPLWRPDLVRRSRRLLACERLAARLTGEAAVRQIADGLRLLNHRNRDRINEIRPLLDEDVRAKAERFAFRRRWDDLSPRLAADISLTAVAYAVAGHRHPILVSYLYYTEKFTIPSGPGIPGRIVGAYTHWPRAVAAIATLRKPRDSAQGPKRYRVSKQTPWRARSCYQPRVYRRDDGTVAVGVLLGPGPLRRRVYLKDYAAAGEARAAIRDPKELRRLYDLFCRWWRQGVPTTHMNMHGSASCWGEARRGPPRRDGDVTAEDFDARFRPRCLAIGASIGQGKRQRMVNCLYDYAWDLAEVLGIEPAELFLGRRVALAIGGRPGRPGSLAFYRPGTRLIGLYQHKGGAAFSLAHEWFHALDWLTPDARGRPPRTTGDLTLCRAVVERIEAAAQPGVPTYRERSQQRDLRGRPSTRYKGILWSREREMGARALEALVRFLARRHNWRHTPVVGLPSWHAYRDAGAGKLYFYPTPYELGACAEELLGMIRTAVARAQQGPPARYVRPPRSRARTAKPR